MRPFVLLEIGSARVAPHVERDLSSFVHDELARVDQLASFDAHIDDKAGEVAMLARIQEGIERLLAENGDTEAEIRRILQDRFEKGALRKETFQLVKSMLDRYVTEHVPTSRGGPDPQGWVSVDQTTQESYFHVDDFAGLAGYAPITGEKSLWCGLREDPGYVSLPVYGDGRNVRDWLHVEDHCSALDLIVREGLPGRTYNVGGRSERTNLLVVHTICDLLDDVPAIDRIMPLLPP